MERFDTIKRGVLTLQELASYLRVHPSTIYRMLRRNQLPAFRIGSDWRFSAEAIDQWVAREQSLLHARTENNALPEPPDVSGASIYG